MGELLLWNAVSGRSTCGTIKITAIRLNNMMSNTDGSGFNRIDRTEPGLAI